MPCRLRAEPTGQAAVSVRAWENDVGIRRYSLFTGRVVDRQPETWGRSPHYHILVEGGGQRFRIAINTRSGTSHNRKSDLLYFADDDFRHAVTVRLADLDDGDREVESRPGGLALDYQRSGMFDRRHMRRIPASRPGPRNDLVDELEYFVERSQCDQTSRLHAYGTRWGPERGTPDHVFGFSPGNGIHDVHMNQGNRDEHWHDNGIWSDGGLIFHEPAHNRWSAIFLAFQTQSWHTDDRGDPVPYPDPIDERQVARDQVTLPPVRIVGAYVHPNDDKRGVEHVAIRNDGEHPLPVSGWRLLNRNGDATILDGAVPPRSVRRFLLPAAVPLSTRGGLIRLLDENGAEVDGVSYTRHEARRKHGTLTF
jgi:uncharacterized protein YukJ